MPLEFAVSINLVENPATRKALEAAAAGETLREFVRLQGVSFTGPCEECTPWFGVRHDGSGTVVPSIPLHPNCVCRDIPLAVYQVANGGSVETLRPFQWMQSTKAGREALAKELGRFRRALLSLDAVKLSDLYKGGRMLTGKDLVARLAAKRGMAEAIESLARRQSIDISGMTLSQSLVRVMTHMGIRL